MRFFCPFKMREQVKQIFFDVTKDIELHFFSSWPWLTAWIDSLSIDIPLKFAVHFDEDEKPICCYFICIQHEQVMPFISLNVAYINNTGIRELDELTAEYNTLWKNSSLPDIYFLDKHTNVDRIELPYFQQALSTDRLNFLIKQRSLKSYWKRLQQDYKQDSIALQSLSKGVRKQLKQSIRVMSQSSDIKLQVAKTVDEALSIYEQLKSLHTISWKARNKKGCFGSSYFDTFHKNFIRDNFDKSSIQLIKVYNSEGVIGCLYNFVHHREVLFYQSGLKYESDNKIRPGLVSHFLAIKHNCELKNKYNFLAGNSRYKKSLSDNFDELHNITLIPKRVSSISKFLLKKIFRTIGSR